MHAQLIHNTVLQKNKAINKDQQFSSQFTKHMEYDTVVQYILWHQSQKHTSLQQGTVSSPVCLRQTSLQQGTWCLWAPSLPLSVYGRPHYSRVPGVSGHHLLPYLSTADLTTAGCLVSLGTISCPIYSWPHYSRVPGVSGHHLLPYLQLTSLQQGAWCLRAPSLPLSISTADLTTAGHHLPLSISTADLTTAGHHLPLSISTADLTTGVWTPSLPLSLSTADQKSPH